MILPLGKHPHSGYSSVPAVEVPAKTLLFPR
jgi:hypothetical protein